MDEVTASPAASAPLLTGTIPAALPRDSNLPALLTEQGTYTFSTLSTESRMIALALARLGVRKGTHVGVLLPNGPEWITTAWAVWQLGATLVPLNTLWTAPELGHALDLADVQLLVATPHFLRHDYASALDSLGIELDRRDAQRARFPCLHTIAWLSAAPVASAVSLAAEMRPLTERELEWLGALQDTIAATDPAAIFFTSGSEAEPKGVIHTHASILAAARGIADRLGLESSDRVWAYLPWFFAGGLVAGVVAPWLVHAAVISHAVFDAGKAISLMEQFQATTFFAWPHQAHAIIAHPDFSAARLRLCKGPGAQTDWAEILYGPNHRAVSSWGMTETGPMASTTAYSDPLEKRRTTHGRPLAGVELRVMDPETGRILPPNEEGELLVRGPTVMLRYCKRRWQDCFDRQGFFHTGDRGWIDRDGYLHFTGRIRDVIKTAGVSVSPSEIEAVLRGYPHVRAAAVVGANDPRRGQCIVAFVVAAPNASVGALDIIAWCRERLAAYKVPQYVFFVNDLPTLGSGKVHKAALAARANELLAQASTGSKS
ncbi:MAG: AMP-binding protein [Candidatus Binatia bacterium]|nr:MAG: AMP-binding protein [Candidatus Binatia bacterium]